MGIANDPITGPIPHLYYVEKVVPEHLIVISQPIPEPGADTELPGMVGGISPGFHVFTLHEHDDRTHVAIILYHAAYASRDEDRSVESALAPWRAPGMLPEWHRKWRDDFIPTLKNLIYSAAARGA